MQYFPRLKVVSAKNYQSICRQVIQIGSNAVMTLLEHSFSNDFFLLFLNCKKS